MAAAARERQTELGTFGDRADGAGNDQVPRLALVRLIGEILGTLGERLDLRRRRPGSARQSIRDDARGGLQERAFLAIESTSAARLRRQRDGQRQTGKAAATADVEQRDLAAAARDLAQRRHCQQRVEHVAARDVCRRRAGRTG